MIRIAAHPPGLHAVDLDVRPERDVLSRARRVDWCAGGLQRERSGDTTAGSGKWWWYRRVIAVAAATVAVAVAVTKM